MTNFPKYSDKKRKGNIGEALVALKLSEFCLVHKIDGSYDVGNDLICELIKEQYPTNLLFYVQVKYSSNKPYISKKLKNYWKDSPIPVYLFWVKPNPGADPDIKYKRYTPILHNTTDKKEGYFKLYKKDSEFKKDLLEDYARTVYIKGSTPVIEPRAFMTVDDKNEHDIQQSYVIHTKQLTEYGDVLIKNGWAHLYTLAYVLSEKSDEQSLNTALSLTKDAQQMIEMDERSQRREYYDYREEIDELRKSIKSKLQNII